MRLLLDENISRRILPFIEPVFPGSNHVVLLDMQRFGDKQIWDFARDNGYVIVSKDADFHEMSILYGQPPQLIWLRSGNVKKAEITQNLIANKDQIERALEVEGVSCLEIYRREI